jgi:hypothetical protein
LYNTASGGGKLEQRAANVYSAVAATYSAPIFSALVEDALILATKRRNRTPSPPAAKAARKAREPKQDSVQLYLLITNHVQHARPTKLY